MHNLRSTLTEENYPKHIKAIYLSITDPDSRQYWAEWLSTINVSKFGLNKFMEEFDLEYSLINYNYSPQSYNFDNIKFFLDILGSKPDELNITRFLSVF